MMRVRIWGCRGSLPSPGPATVRYGGNTSCVEVLLGSGEVLVVDAGSGIRGLGVDLAHRGVRHVHLLLTHLHLDHIEGLRFFAPLFDDGVRLEIWGPSSPVFSLRERLARSFSPPLFPIDLRGVPARIGFHDVPREPWRIAGATVSAALVSHPGPTLGYRVETDGSSVAYLPDHEPALAGALVGTPRDWISGASVAEDSNLLLHDAQFGADEYAQRIGWGHSSVGDAVAFARATGSRRLVLFHHDPSRSDQALEELEAEAHSLADGAPPPTLAREGTIIDVH